MKSGNTILKKTTLAVLVSAALATSGTASAKTLEFSYIGYFRMLDSNGAGLANSSFLASVNQYETPISGTLTYDTVAGIGTGTMEPFSFFNNPILASLTQFEIRAIGDGTCDSVTNTSAACVGPLLLVNMTFNWGGNNGIPVSLVWDASALFNASTNNPKNLDDFVPPRTFNQSSADAVRGAADGTYIGVGNGDHRTNGYLDLGVVPIATLKYDTTTLCTPGGGNTGACMNVFPSGGLPLIVDNAANANDFVPAFMGGTGQEDPGKGGSAMAAGPFTGFFANFDLTSVVLEGTSDSVPFTAPLNPPTVTPAVTTRPASYSVNLGTVADEPITATIEYSFDGLDNLDPNKQWFPDDGLNNPILVPTPQTVNTLIVTWRGTDPNFARGFKTQTVTVDFVDDQAPSVTVPENVTVNFNDTIDTLVMFGVATATDNMEPSANLTIEWSLDQSVWNISDPSGNGSISFGPNDNTVYWRATDAHGNVGTATQQVIRTLPDGIFGATCQADLTTEGRRLLEGEFVMFNPDGSLTKPLADTAVTGDIDTTAFCPANDESCIDYSATLKSDTPFFGFPWKANLVRLYGAGTHSFHTIEDGNPVLSMTVKESQIGAHMLFDWGGPETGGCGVTNCNIDVVVVWDVGCGNAMLQTTDPDGDGIPGTKMIDGPFKGYSATFNMNTKAGEPPITTGGFAVNVPAIKNPVADGAPLPLTPGASAVGAGTGVAMTSAELGAASDSAVTRSCVGGCFDFVATGLANAGDSIQVVLPLDQAIPYYSIYRKYNPATSSWRTFDTSTGDKVETALRDANDRCPEPSSGSYSVYSNSILAGMLRPDDQCIQLTIKDNGPNDNDPVVQQIADPGGIGVTSGPSSPTTPTSDGGGGGGLDWWSLAGLLAALRGVTRRGKIRE